jgi:prolipoprotein diacylglyceryl transferase
VPSPPSSTFSLGPVSGHWYGLLIGVAALLFTAVTALCWHRRGGDWERAVWLCLAALPAALLGARLYHLVTGGSFGPEQGVAVWAGGLGLYGAVAAGALVLGGGAWLLGLDALRFLDCATPGLALAQAVGRLGNWFNQELYGRPTDLPWGLEIDPAHRLPGLERYSRFQPTFAYEALWDLALAAILWRLVAGRRTPRRGVPLGLWLAGYGLGRFWIEGLRAEKAEHLGPLRVNQVVALAAIAAGLLLVAHAARRPVRA